MRLIDADALRAKMRQTSRYFYIKYDIDDAPTVDAVQVVHGHWIRHPDDLFPAESMQECSVCHEQEYFTLCNEKYCPNCGAKMDGADHENI